jgi:hypothetical protein
VHSQVAFLVKNVFLPPAAVSVSAPTKWLTALTLLVQASHIGTYAFFDDDGQMMISGYALRAAGLMNADLSPTVQLSETDRQEYGLIGQPSEEAAMVAFLQIYVQALGDVIAHYIGHSETDALVSRLARHQIEAVSWLAGHGDSTSAPRVGCWVPLATGEQ